MIQKEGPVDLAVPDDSSGRELGIFNALFSIGS